jgi:hypothetical protein
VEANNFIAVNIYVDISLVDIQTAISNSTLIPRTTYHITDLDVYFEAISNNSLKNIGVRRMLVPSNYTETTDSHGNVWKSVWYPDISVTTNDLVIYFGQVFKSLTGVTGTGDVSTRLLDATNWELINRTSFTNYEYTYQYYECMVDFTIGAIIWQRDKYDNIVSIPKFIEGMFDYSVLDYCDWGWYMGVNTATLSSIVGGAYINNKFIYSGRVYTPVSFFGFANNRNCVVCNNRTTWIYNNYTDGFGKIDSNIVLEGIDINHHAAEFIIDDNHASRIKNNIGNGSFFRIQSNILNSTIVYGRIEDNSSGRIEDNICGAIEGNSTTTRICQNVVEGTIYNNAGAIIENNLNCVSISSNTADSIIENNNTGIIYNNSNSGVISQNGNVGEISNNSCGTITNNNNNGDIKNNSISGYIVQNTNNGDIVDNTGTGNIHHNINNGYIGGLILTGDITDTIVNKE